jgi:hypothetical protein
MPVHQYTSTPLRQYTSMSVHQYAITPVRQYASTSVHQYAITPACQYAIMPVCQYASTPVCHYASRTVCQYTITHLFPPYYLNCIPHYQLSAQRVITYTIKSASSRLTHPFFIALRGRRIGLQGRRIGLLLHRLSSGFALLGMRRRGITMRRGRSQFSRGRLDHRDQGATPTTIAPPRQSGTHPSQTTCMRNTWRWNTCIRNYGHGRHTDSRPMQQRRQPLYDKQPKYTR